MYGFTRGFIMYTQVFCCIVHSFTLTGEIQFEDKFKDGEKFPANSWLIVKIEDITRTDSNAVEIGKDEQNISFCQMTKKLMYSISNDVRITPNNGKMFSVYAVINVGWRASNRRWIRDGDYISKSEHVIDAENAGGSSFVENIEVRIEK